MRIIGTGLWFMTTATNYLAEIMKFLVGLAELAKWQLIITSEQW